MKNTNKGRRGLLRVFKLCALLSIPFALESCGFHESNRQFAPGVGQSRIAGLKTIYVRKHSDDDYRLGEDVADQLQQMGYKASAGSHESPPHVDAVISIKDQWTWDMTMYLFSLELQLREPKSDVVFATAKTTRTSLVRKSQKEMVRETLTKLLTN
jgi:hypothetical protein